MILPPPRQICERFSADACRFAAMPRRQSLISHFAPAAFRQSSPATTNARFAIAVMLGAAYHRSRRAVRGWRHAPACSQLLGALSALARSRSVPHYSAPARRRAQAAEAAILCIGRRHSQPVLSGQERVTAARPHFKSFPAVGTARDLSGRRRRHICRTTDAELRCDDSRPLRAASLLCVVFYADDGAGRLRFQLRCSQAPGPSGCRRIVLSRPGLDTINMFLILGDDFSSVSLP